MTDPRATRPYMPAYGILTASEGTGLLPWSWAVERLERSHDYWLGTVWPDARPHVVPVWGVWREDALWFSSSKTSRKARNQAANPHAVMTTDNALEPVVIEGRVELVVERSAIERFAGWADANYSTSYGVDFYAAPGNRCFRLVPTWVFALTEADFTGSPTRWKFER